MSNNDTHPYMTPEERDLITGLFNRLRNLNAGPKDAEAEQFIQQQMAALPETPYYLVQTLLVQEHALQNAQLRIAQLEKQAAAFNQGQPQGTGSFLSGLLHRNAPAAQPQQVAPPPLPQTMPYPTTASMSPSGGGGFLKGALATAAGVAGGSLLFQGIEDLLGHRSGGFGSMLGGGGFVGSGFGGERVVENTEVVNNYYGDSPAGGSDPALQTGGSDFAPVEDADPSLGSDPGNFTDPGDVSDPGSFDNSGGGDFGGGGDSLV